MQLKGFRCLSVGGRSQSGDWQEGGAYRTLVAPYVNTQPISWEYSGRHTAWLKSSLSLKTWHQCVRWGSVTMVTGGEGFYWLMRLKCTEVRGQSVEQQPAYKCSSSLAAHWTGRERKWLQTLTGRQETKWRTVNLIQWHLISSIESDWSPLRCLLTYWAACSVCPPPASVFGRSAYRRQDHRSHDCSSNQIHPCAERHFSYSSCCYSHIYIYIYTYIYIYIYIYIYMYICIYCICVNELDQSHGSAF